MRDILEPDPTDVDTLAGGGNNRAKQDKRNQHVDENHWNSMLIALIIGDSGTLLLCCGFR
ncbi:hypothetical protein PCO82_21855 [Pectobacteriaceae bacterium CE90]|nr:hypothetical protein [Prodigiosinella sp. LS101]WJV53956.1 hypothetical protein PCO85_00205 [Prodigiosinella sp. LS101]WJV58318.1 hypothetical protein PCO84_00205 [Pectobacteriaceae bacterium C111]WJY15048.1 hypothetical protein PCO82_21855 [Pectobacteriaceae bacterium CE90]